MTHSDAIPVVPPKQLSPDQIACLRGVLAHRTSKEIARELGVSPHTVDARIRAALKQLGVETRREAALILEKMESQEPYQPFAYQPPSLPRAGLAGDQESRPWSSAGDVIYPVPDETEGEQKKHRLNDGGASVWSDAGHERGGKAGWWQHRNQMGMFQRVMAIVAISLGSATTVAVIALGLHALAALIS